MPATPRATVIGLGSAALIAAVIFLIPIIVLTTQVAAHSQQPIIRQQTEAAVKALRDHGYDNDGIPAPQPVPLKDTAIRLLPVVGPYSAFVDPAVPLHYQPDALVVYVGSTDPSRESISADELRDQTGTLGELLGCEEAIGIPIAFTDGTVWMLHETTPPRELALFMRRDTMAQNRLTKLEPFHRDERERYNRDR